MKRLVLRSSCLFNSALLARAVLVAAALLTAVRPSAGGISESEYAGRRDAVAAALDTGAVAIFRAADMKTGTGRKAIFCI